MTAAAKPSFGNSLLICPAGGTLVAVAELLSIEPPKTARDTIDVTTHDSSGGAMEYIAEGVYETGEVKGTLHYVPNSTFDVAALLAITTGAKQDVKIIAKGASGNRQKTFSGFLIEYGPDGFEVKGKQTASFSIKVTGVVTEASAA